MKNAILVCLLAACCYAMAGREEASEEDPKEVRKVVIERCRSEMGAYGAAIVKGCVDMDMKAYEALKRYSVTHRPIVDRCKESMGEYGWAIIKGCADMDIEAEQALEAY